MLIRRRILRHGSRITVRDGGLLQRCIDLLGDGDNIAQRRRIGRELIREGGASFPDGRQLGTRRGSRVAGGGLWQVLGKLTQFGTNYRLGIVGAQHVEVIQYGRFGVLLAV